MNRAIRAASPCCKLADIDILGCACLPLTFIRCYRYTVRNYLSRDTTMTTLYDETKTSEVLLKPYPHSERGQQVRIDIRLCCIINSTSAHHSYQMSLLLFYS